MKINPNHHLPAEMSELIEEVYEERYDYYSSYCDDDYLPYAFALDEYSESIKTYMYAYVGELDKIMYNPQIKDLGDYTPVEVYEDCDGVLHHSVYSFRHPHKLTALMGCIIAFLKETKNPPSKIVKLYNRLSNDYPEITLRLL